jgi:hypothetical protein
MTRRRYRQMASMFNYLSISLVVAGCVDFFFIGHNFRRAQMFLIAAVTALLGAAIGFGMVRRSEIEDTKRGRKSAQIGYYLFIVICIVVAVLNLITDFWRSTVIQLGLAIFFVLGLAKIFFDQLFVNRFDREPLNVIQRLSILLGIAMLLLQFYQFSLIYFPG